MKVTIRTLIAIVAITSPAVQIAKASDDKPRVMEVKRDVSQRKVEDLKLEALILERIRALNKQSQMDASIAAAFAPKDSDQVWDQLEKSVSSNLDH